MATYYDLPYTGAEVASDLAKVHDKTSLVEEAPIDGKEYVRKNGGWVDLGLGDLSSVIDLANGEVVTVSLTNNQGAEMDYSGAVVHVVYDSEDHTYSVSGSSVVFVVPCNKSCTVSVGAIENYKAPDAVTFTSGTNSERSITLEYQSESVSVTLSVTNVTGMDGSGLTISINGTEYTWSGTAITTLIPFGTTYTISVSGDGVIYTTPEAETYTAESKSREVALEVSVNTGIYIQDIDGKYYTSDTWDTANNANANGVAVILSTCQFVIVPNVNSTAKWASSASVNLTAINKTSANNAKADYNGKSNTTTMLTNTYCNASGCAAYVCANTISKRGKRGYLGAAGEMYAVYQNKTAINTLLALIGGTAIGTGYYWTSDQNYEYSSYYAWRVVMSNGGVSSQTQTTSYYIRVLTEL